MLSTIRFHNQASTKMYKIDHIGANRLLTPEFFAVQPMRPQVSPESVLAVRHVASQLPDKFMLFHAPSPQPLSRKGRGALTDVQRIRLDLMAITSWRAFWQAPSSHAIIPE